MLIPAALAVLGIAATGCADQTDSDAVTVGSQTMSSQDFLDEVEAIADNDDFVQQFGLETEGEMLGSYSQEFVGLIMGQRVSFMINAEMAEELDVDVSTSESAALQSLSQQYGAAFDAFPESYRDQLIGDVAAQVALDEAVQQSEAGGDGPSLAEAQQLFVRLVDEVDVAPRYGDWDSEAFLSGDNGVLAPDGPLLRTPAEQEADAAADAADGTGAVAPDASASGG